jgi:hypothetical protein
MFKNRDHPLPIELGQIHKEAMAAGGEELTDGDHFFRRGVSGGTSGSSSPVMISVGWVIRCRRQRCRVLAGGELPQERSGAGNSAWRFQ